MIERLYLKNHLSFKEVELEFLDNLIVFSGPSGAGKSILMEAILALFGLKDTNASLIEANINAKLSLEEWGIEEDEPNIFKFLKTKSSRYFINGQSVSKKNIKEISKRFIDYLSFKEFKELENSALLDVADSIASKEDSSYKKILTLYKKTYDELKDTKSKLDKIEEDERKIQELKEFAAYEIDKINQIDPKPGEYEKLFEFKKSLSKKEKIEEAISKAYAIFESEQSVTEALNLLEIDSTFFDEAMNELRALFESASEKLDELQEMDIESLLDRIEKLSSLIRRYGSIEESLKYKEKKEKELAHYENIAFEKEQLQKKVLELEQKAYELSSTMSKKRDKAIKLFKERVNYYLEKLYLNSADIVKESIPLNERGEDFIKVKLGRVDLKKISAGELNRVRLAFIAASNEFIMDKRYGVLILDEVDANLSGKESMSVANVLKKLSENYRIFAISHQPQLSSKANMHYLVKKDAGVSKVLLLKGEQRVKELARMVSGEKITDEAMEFARSFLSH